MGRQTNLIDWQKLGEIMLIRKLYTFELIGIFSPQKINQKCIEDVGALMANGQFLSWEFNVFNLEEVSGGHSLW